MLSLAKNSSTLRAAEHGTMSRFRRQAPETICEAVSDKLHIEGVAEAFYRHSDSGCGLGEIIHDLPDPPCQRKQSAVS